MISERNDGEEKTGKVNYYAVCYNCPAIREEDGAYMSPPGTVVDFDDRTTKEEVLKASHEHEAKYGTHHRIEIRLYEEQL